MGWTDLERLICVLEDGSVLMYDVFGELTRKLILDGDCREKGVLDCIIYGI